jgi:hypothetical protein
MKEGGGNILEVGETTVTEGVMVVVVDSIVKMVVRSVAGAVSVDTSVEVTVVVSVSVSMMLCAAASPARRVMRREKGRMVAVLFRLLGRDLCTVLWVSKCSLDKDAFESRGSESPEERDGTVCRWGCVSDKAHAMPVLAVFFRVFPPSAPLGLARGGELRGS